MSELAKMGLMKARSNKTSRPLYVEKATAEDSTQEAEKERKSKATTETAERYQANHSPPGNNEIECFPGVNDGECLSGPFANKVEGITK